MTHDGSKSRSASETRTRQHDASRPQLQHAHCSPSVMWRPVADSICCSENHRYHNQLIWVMKDHAVGPTSWVLSAYFARLDRPVSRIINRIAGTVPTESVGRLPGVLLARLYRNHPHGAITSCTKCRVCCRFASHLFFLKHLPRLRNPVPEGNASSRIGAPAGVESRRSHCTVSDEHMP